MSRFIPFKTNAGRLPDLSTEEFVIFENGCRKGFANGTAAEDGEFSNAGSIGNLGNLSDGDDERFPERNKFFNCVGLFSEELMRETLFGTVKTVADLSKDLPGANIAEAFSFNGISTTGIEADVIASGSAVILCSVSFKTVVGTISVISTFKLSTRSLGGDEISICAILSVF